MSEGRESKRVYKPVGLLGPLQGCIVRYAKGDPNVAARRQLAQATALKVGCTSDVTGYTELLTSPCASIKEVVVVILTVILGLFSCTSLPHHKFNPP